MRRKIYRVHLTTDEQQRLEDLMTKGIHPARQITRAHILLLEELGAWGVNRNEKQKIVK